MLQRKVEELGVSVHLTHRCQAIESDSETDCQSVPPFHLRFDSGERLSVDLVVISAGIRPRDELAKQAGLAIGERGGIVVDDYLKTSDPRILF